jgi:hypothetical protein
MYAVMRPHTCNTVYTIEKSDSTVKIPLEKTEDSVFKYHMGSVSDTA